VDDLESMRPDELAGLRDRLVSLLSDTAVFTPGSFQEEWRRCGKGNCHCAKEGDQGHGPFYSVERWEAGRTRKRRVPASAVLQVKERVAAWGQFQKVCSQLADVNAEESRRLLLEPGGETRGPALAGQKGGVPARM